MFSLLILLAIVSLALGWFDGDWHLQRAECGSASIKNPFAQIDVQLQRLS